MCGIVAMIGAGPTFDDAVRLVEHRGVRGKTITTPKGTSLHHRRLPIVGVGEEYDQPVQVNHWHVAFVGELLDFKRHRQTLTCDLPLVLWTWDKDGPLGFNRFDGFWMVVAVDDRDGSIHVVVDYLSQKPAYYRCDEQVQGVASELDAVAAMGRVTLDEVYLAAVVKWGYCSETWRTPYNEVRRLMPGHYMKLKKWVAYPYFQEVDMLRPRVAGPEDLKASVIDAVRLRVQSADVPVACLVSGGLDSSIVYTLAQRFGDVVPYHVEIGADENYAAVAPDARVIEIGSVRAVPSLSKMIRYMQEPVDLGSLVPQVMLSDAVGKTNAERVCLTGDGADEFFGGYGRAQRYDSQASDVWHELVNYHIPRLDRVMMRNRIEVRSPFLSREVASIALGLPRAERTGKKVLRDLFRSDLPAGVADRPKVPLRTKEVEADREAWSIKLVEEFRREKVGMRWGH